MATKFDKYRTFLNVANVTLNKDMKEYLNEINLNKSIIALLDKRSNRKRVTLAEYEELAKYGCPSASAFKDFCQEHGLMETEESDHISLSEDYPRACSVTESCGECWKKHIDNMVDLINNIPGLSVKVIQDDENNKDKK